MEKFIVKNFYKLILLFFILSGAIISFLHYKSLNTILAIIIFILLFFFIYFIHSNAHNKIRKNFIFKKHLIEDTEKKYLTEEELIKLYSEEYENYFKK